jgi:Domain of unknown function (DUF4062)
MLPYRVFVSSTFVDLKSHRQSVRDGVRELGAIDVAMENLGARDERPKDECVRLVKLESDFFVGIYAHRYGFVPDGDDISVTEAEYEAASAASLPRLIYMVDEDAPWKPSAIERGEGATKLEKLKKRLRARHICKLFATPDELRAHVCADLGREILRQVLPRVSPDGQSTIAASDMTPRRVEEWNKHRYAIYKNQRDIFLVHTITPSKLPNQRYDIAIYLARHQSTDLSEVCYAEFFLGPYWGDHVFKVTNDGGPIGILTSAYDTFLCYCCVTFVDGTKMTTSRYIDFESGDARDAVAPLLARKDEKRAPVKIAPPITAIRKRTRRNAG